MNLARERACSGKKTHRTRAAAVTAMRAQIARGARRLNAYKCMHCGRYHVGHLPYDPPEPTP
jgi:hypothetical protein